ncbi:glycosyltransferase [Fibrobacterota bacterium]
MLTLTSIILLFLHSVYFLVNRILIKGLNRLLGDVDRDEQVTGADHRDKKVSVLIAVRNEEKSLNSCLDALLKQDYPREKLEIILVNDRSTDKTAAILESYSSKHPDLFKTIDVDNGESSQSPKKYALNKGIKMCTGEIILSTDADCVFKKQWISAMISKFNSDTGMVLGPVLHYKNPKMNQFLWGIQALEFFSHTVVSSSLIANDFPINASANNMAYRKIAFSQAGGFGAHQHIISGDDDFLMQKISYLKTWKIRFSTCPDSAVQTRPCTTFRHIWEQRKRWASKCSFYARKQVFFLSYVYLYYFLILSLVICGLVSLPVLALGLASWSFKTWMDYNALKLGAKLFSQEKLLDWFLPAAIIQNSIFPS